jgi:hypothetical protein
MRFSANSACSALIVVLAAAFLALHLPYLPASLEDLDSINFALGIRQFDVPRHQPHPPGYPVYIAIAKAVRAVGASELTALALVSIAAGTLGVLAIAALFRRLGAEQPDTMWPVAAVAVAMTSPLYWFTAVRPLSDTAGLAAAVAVQAFTLAAGTRRGLAVAAFCAGLATGIRSQIAWLTLPLLAVKMLDARAWMPWELDGAERQLAPGIQRRASIAIAFLAGVLVWFIPLVAVSGGPSAYWHALSDQGAEDFGNIQMLWTTHTVRAVAEALYYTFVAPWALWPVAVLVLLFAAIGVVRSWRGARTALAALAVGFGPYLAFHLLFQETFTGRYALPLVVPMAWLAVAGLRALPAGAAAGVAMALAMYDAHLGGTSIAAYARAKAPAFRLVADMAAAAPSASAAPVLAMDRRNAFDFRRPIVWTGDAMPRFTATLPAPPQHEWLEAVKYWNDGGRAPVWFVVDPMRTSIDLVQHGRPAQYRWPLPYPTLVSGARPNEMDWYRVDRPEWYAGEGWALTPESAGVAEADGRGLHRGPITSWISGATAGGRLMLGGRNLDPVPQPLQVMLAGTAIGGAELVPAGAFLRFIPLPDASRARSEYLPLVVSTSTGARVAIEQFDASATRPIVGYGSGWHEQEFNPRTGARWRWLSERGELPFDGAGPRSVLHVEGESPRTYFSRSSRLTVRVDGNVVFDRQLDADFALDIPIAVAAGTIVLETDQVFSPADRSSRTADRRHLGLRIFKCELARP